MPHSHPSAPLTFYLLPAGHSQSGLSACLLYPLLEGEIMADQGVPRIDHCPPSTQKVGLILCAPENPGTNMCMMEMACFLTWRAGIC